MKQAVMYGGGNIGRGFIGATLSQSGYEVTFIDVAEPVVKALQEKKQYPVRYVSSEGHEDVMIEHVTAVNGNDQEAASEAIANCDIMATAVGARILKFIVGNIVAGLRKRWARDDRPLNIIICENLMDADQYLKNLVQPNGNVGFVEASVGRMVPVMTDEMREGDITKVWVEPFCTLPVDREAFLNPIPPIKGMLPDAPFAYYIQSKLYLHNMGHAVAAYMGKKKGYRYIWQAMEDEAIHETVKNAMYASALALHFEHDKPKDEVIAYADDLLFRFQNRYLGDTTDRVGRDVERKLAPKDRLLGALKLCQKHHVPTDNIKRGIMAALDYIYEEEK